MGSKLGEDNWYINTAAAMVLMLHIHRWRDDIWCVYYKAIKTNKNRTLHVD